MIKKLFTGLLLAATIASSIALAAPAAALDYTKTPNKYVEVGGTRYAYRTIGERGNKPPLVLFQHFTGTMDDWDRRTIEGLAKSREIIIFNNAGVGASGGSAPDSVSGMARVGEGLVDALGLREIDVLGFSVGGAIVQHILSDRPELIRKAIIVGSGPQGSPGLKALPEVIEAGIKKSNETGAHLRVVLFFTETDTGKAAGAEYLRNINNHSVDPEAPVSEATRNAQAKAIVTWGSMENNYVQLAQITQPVLIVNGSNDLIAPTLESVVLFQHIPNAQLSLYPDSGHGSLFQHHALFVSQVDTFLDGPK
ncbi:alpha/beta hydrolase [Hyphomicrobium nitrativorans NL23]|uniref:Alpha/beta hydrolase n=1 Tax=Hyphomicrobium nitrativorans NL23 TaxID=1029756 RepID=V5SD20_9HYPH|nr:alpha/beta hydrolase [Hyphomicrobium nitrativorans]AHB47839.1 alpha/beta hydrolase [Hyphomicrobium nitrativorans NL23]